MNRRSFLSLCGLAAGSCLVPGSVARLIRETCVLAEEPYLVLPRNPSSVLYALTTDGKTDFMLHYGDPLAASKPPTWAEYFDEFEGFKFQDKKAVHEWWNEQVGDPEDEDDPITIKAEETIDGVALEKWENRQEMHDGPAALAYRMLEDMPLDDGRGEVGGQRLGRLRFIEGDRPGSNLTYVEAPDLATLACLQNRLNELGQNLAIEIREW